MPQQPFDPAAFWREQRLIAGASTPEDEFMPEEQSTWNVILDALNKPGSALRGGIRAGVRGESIFGGLSEGWKQNVSTDDILGDLGMADDGNRAVAGFLGDLALDPLNLIPGKALSDVAGAAKRGMKATGNVVAKSGRMGALTDQLLNDITPFRDLRNVEPYQQLSRNTELELQALPEIEAASIKNRLMPLMEGKMNRVEGASSMANAMQAADARTLHTLNPLDRTVADEIIAIGKDQRARSIAAGVSELDKHDLVPRFFDRKGYNTPVTPGSSRLNLGKPQFVADEKIGSFAQGIQQGLTPDLNAISALTRRGVEGERARVLASHLKSLVNDPAMKGIAIEDAISPLAVDLKQKGWREFHTAKVPQAVQDAMRGKILAPEVHEHLSRLFSVQDLDSSAFGQVIDAVNNVWKPLATTVRPAFHLRNLISNVYLMLAGGADLASIPTRFAEAIDVLHNPANQWHEVFKRLGITGSEFGVTADTVRVGEDALNSLDPATLGGTVKDIVTAPLKAGQVVGKKFEDASRAALALDLIAKGMPIDQVATHVNKWLINYGESTKFEREWMRRIIPFYCVPEEAQALTRDGWKCHTDIVIGEELLTYNLEKDELEWALCEEVAVFPFEGELNTFTSPKNGMNIAFTAEHRWVVQKPHWPDKRLIPASEIVNADKVMIAAPYNGNSDSILTPEQAKLLGWLLTDGYYRWKGNYLEGMIYQSPKKFLDEVKQVAGGTPRKPHPDTGVVCVPVLKERMEVLKPFLTKIKSQMDFTPIITRLSKDAIDAMYGAMYQADGNVCTGPCFAAAEIMSVRKAFQLLALLRGYRSTPIRENGQRGIYLSERRTFKVARQGKKAYSGSVWCPRTKNGTWVMLQNGIAVITGNTFQRRIVPLLAETLLTKPTLISGQAKLNEMFENFVPESEQIAPNLRPEYVQEQGMPQFPGKGPGGESYFANLGLPGPDLNIIPTNILGIGLPGSSVSDVGEEILGRLTPLKAPLLEVPMNRAFGTGAEIYPGGDKMEPRPASGVSMLLIEAGMGDLIGATMFKGRWHVPATVNYLLSQGVPIAEGLGKGLRQSAPGVSGEEGIDALPFGVSRNVWNLIAPPSIARDTPAALKKRYEEARKLQRNKAIKQFPQE